MLNLVRRILCYVTCLERANCMFASNVCLSPRCHLLSQVSCGTRIETSATVRPVYQHNRLLTCSYLATTTATTSAFTKHTPSSRSYQHERNCQFAFVVASNINKTSVRMLEKLEQRKPSSLHHLLSRVGPISTNEWRRVVEQLAFIVMRARSCEG